ncbi:hypothetical protein [Thermosipho sp. 1244]|uniref:hypothetical protein n=1 Tax=Thermosipho sp. 1244 TaxID=1755816 RepID=UPI001BDF6B29|nr:hypothetical protein [Thermosipho sp. 1244]MBT1248691.1 hypothetical protein [Thermosipho sp. 1244]
MDSFKEQLKSKRFLNFKHSIGDGFLLVWENSTTPTLYITEIELERHNINKHILPQLGNFISFIQSSTLEELNGVRNFLYMEIKQNKAVFNKIRKDSEKEVYEILDNAIDDLQILLVIDRVSPELSIGLSQIEKAINIKIRKVEISRFVSDRGEEIVLFTDSEYIEFEEKESLDKEFNMYSIEYHLDNKPEKIVDIVEDILNFAKERKLKISPMKLYIGIFKGKRMVFSIVPRKNSVVFYSKVKIKEMKPSNLNVRDVSNIGHYTNHLPTEIVVNEYEQLPYLKEYLNDILNFVEKMK